MTSEQANAGALEKELTWFNTVLETRISSYFQQPGDHADIYAIEPPPLTGDPSEYGRLVQEYGMTFDERIVLMLALIPHIRPQLLDTLFIRNKNFDRGFTEFGGWKGTIHGGFLPTCETAAFILAGSDLAKRFEVARLFEPDHFFARKGMIRLDNHANGEPLFSGSLCITTEYLQRFTSGVCHKPDFTMNFPAKLITTGLSWDDLVLPPDVLEDIESINTWISDSRIIMEEWGLKTTIKPGYRSLFYGPPGTGKTLTATLIGAFNGVDVYRIDLSMVVSKFIGETEKNLASVFDQAEHKNWILFFDEADALFGKRTQTSSSNDRYANQEISYLLQRVEDFPGVVILATNLKANIDEAFARRFQSVVYFPMPDSDQRLRLWQGMLGKSPPPMADDVSLERLADDFELSGGAITNVIRFAAIKALRRSERFITQGDLLKGVARELMKEGRTMQPS
jgi:hypothetical protein